MEDLFDGLTAAPTAPGVAAPGGGTAAFASTDGLEKLGPREAMDAALAQADAATTHLMAAMARLGEHPEELDTAYLERLLQQVQTLSNKHGRLRVRALDVVRATREVGNAHHENDAQFTAGRTRTRRAQAGRDADLAKALGNHTPTPPPTDPGSPSSDGAGLLDGAGDGSQAGGAHGGAVQTPTAAAWDAGLITRDHALIITRALDDLPEGLTAEQRHTVEVDLVGKAQQMNPTRLGKAAKRALEALDLPVEEVDAHHNELVHAEETAAWDAASFWMKDNRDGTWFGQFTLPALQAQMLKKALDSMTSPRRHTKGGGTPGAATGAAATGATAGNGAAFGPTGSQAATAGGAWTGDVRFDRELRDQQRGQALAELIDHLPTDHLHPKINTILLVTTDLETLRGQTDRVGVTDTGDDVSAAQVRRLASNAALIPIVMNGASVPLDLGRKRRSFTESQKAALATKYDSCAEEDCDRPFAWCEIHHADPWRPVYAPDGTLLHPGGGKTDLSNGIPLCGRHHRQMDDPRLKHTITTDAEGRATIRFTWRRPGEPWSTRLQTSDPATPAPPARSPSGPDTGRPLSGQADTT
ncbi:DUF222 domain-containing protein [Kytococcus sedentarius]|uniref:HNH endonuclease signature motif containing protein n=1 Tax=Kytococcus sedentarius TaxID=1276 RepID=UPI0035BBB1F9